MSIDPRISVPSVCPSSARVLLMLLTLPVWVSCDASPSPGGRAGDASRVAVSETATSRPTSRPTIAANEPKVADGEPRVSTSGFDLTPLTTSKQEWRERLTEQQFRIAFEAGTERPFRNEYWDHHEAGTYVCIAGGLPLFSSETKFDSGTGWPSFYAPFDPAHVELHEDHSLLGHPPRVEVVCARSGAHLGHVFDDGPPPTHKRYCINSAALRFVPKGQPLGQLSDPVESTGESRSR